MEFDKSKVYTVLNADELKVGSEVFLADNISFLKKLVKDDAVTTNLVRVLGEETNSRFEGISDIFSLAYLVSPPAEPEYKPFTDNKTALKIIAAHSRWVKVKQNGFYELITALNIGCDSKNEIAVNGGWLSAEYVFKHFTFEDDGMPVGEKVDGNNSNLNE